MPPTKSQEFLVPVVVARLKPIPEKFDDVIRVYKEFVPLVHKEPGCELFALHANDHTVILVERWATAGDLRAHGASANLAEIRRRLAGLLTVPSEIEVVENIPAGDPHLGTIQ
jgi:quinol monooxygenase YgiN